MRPPRLLLLLSLSAFATSVLSQGQSSADAPPTTAAQPAPAPTVSKAPDPAPAAESKAVTTAPAPAAPQNTADTNPIGGLQSMGAQAAADASKSLAAASASAAAAAAKQTDAPGGGNKLDITISIDTNRDLTGGIAPKLEIPPISKQPFMQASSVPEGTVFIAVGAGLGLCLLILFLWRALVAWSINRSVKKAGFAPMQKQHNHLEKEMKSLNSFGKKSNNNGGGPGSFYTAAAPSSLSLSDNYGVGGAGGARSQSGLFFSPSAAAGLASPGTPVSSGIGSPAGFQGDNRRSGYYPAGYYNAPGNRASVASFTRQPRAQGSGYLSSEGVSPPGSPMVRPEAGGSRGTERASGNAGGRYGDLGGASQSSLSLNLPPQGRAPSAVLEDLFESHKTGGRSPLSDGRGY